MNIIAKYLKIDIIYTTAYSGKRVVCENCKRAGEGGSPVIETDEPHYSQSVATPLSIESIFGVVP